MAYRSTRNWVGILYLTFGAFLFAGLVVITLSVVISPTMFPTFPPFVVFGIVLLVLGFIAGLAMVITGTWKSYKRKTHR